MMGQRRPLGIGAAGALLLSGCDISLRAGPFKPCETLLPAALRDDLRVHAAWQGMDATQVLDTHCHVFGAIPQLNRKRPYPPRWRHLGGAWLPSSMPLGPRQMAWAMDLKEPQHASRLATAQEPR
jgi:hypothetical protein